MPDTARDPHAVSILAGIAEVTGGLQVALGQKLTAQIADAHPQTVGRWAKTSQLPHPDNELRLRTAFQILLLLREGVGEQAARAWFGSPNPQLDDESPADVIRDGRMREAMAAARAFMAP